MFPKRLDSTAIKQLQADLRKLTKIYQSVPTGMTYDPGSGTNTYDDPQLAEKWQEAARIFGQYAENLKDWVYGTIIPHLDSDRDSYEQKQLREKAWSLYLDIAASSVFPSQWNPTTARQEIAPWKLEKDRDKLIRRYQRRFRDLIEALEACLAAEGGTIERAPVSETFTLAGMNVVVRNAERDQRADQDYADFMHDLKRQVSRIQAAGLGLAVRGMTLVVSFGSGAGLGGEYDYEKDEVRIFPLGQSSSSSAFTHEVGHRFYFRNLTNNARAHWEQIISTQQAKTDAAALDAFMEHIYAEGLDRHAMFQRIEQSRFDPETRAKLRYFAAQDPAYTSKPDEVKQHHLKFNIGKPVMLEHITNYGATSPWEAFAEAFQLYVIKGPRSLGLWTRSFFERIRNGGKLASAARVLERWRRNAFESHSLLSRNILES